MTELSNAQRIALLAASLDDWLPSPWQGRREAWMARRDWRKEGPAEVISCVSCAGRGKVLGGRRTRPCEACGGKGSVKVDDYTGQAVEEAGGENLVELVRAVADEVGQDDFELRERRRRRVDLLLAGDRGGEDWADWMLRRKKAQYRSGDYARLERCALALGPRLQRAFWLVYGPEAGDRVAGPRLRELAGMALAELDRLMPDCRVPEWLLGPRTRDEEIRALNARRKSQAEIAQAVGVSQSTVSRVLKARVA